MPFRDVKVNARQHVFAVGASVVVFQGDDIVPDVPSFQIILRVGYNWGQNPVPANTAIPQRSIGTTVETTGLTNER